MYFCGGMVDGLGDTAGNDMDSFKVNSGLYLVIGTVTGCVGWGIVTLWSILAHRITYKTKIAYLSKTLEMDANFYD